jgi:hyperosmotically inducible protein
MLRLPAAMLLALVVIGCAAGRSAPQTAPPDDQTLKTRVETSLLNSTGVHPNEISTEVSAGVVTLSGTVHDQAEADAAVNAARRVAGVKDVRSNLRTK